MAQNIYNFYGIGGSTIIWQFAAGATTSLPQNINFASFVVISTPANFDSLSGQNTLLYGMGSDGDVTVNTTVTLTSDMYYSTLNVGLSGVINTQNFRIFCRDYLNNNGVIQCNGINASDSTGVSGVPTGVFVGSAKGGNGGNFAGSNGTNPLYGFGGNGGRGGAGSSGSSGGTGGAITSLSAVQGGTYLILNPFQAVLACGLKLTTAFTGGGGGGGGGGDGGSTFGGGGGSGGGIVMVFAKNILGQGTFKAVGGNGGDGAIGDPAGSSGGGGGGGGGLIALYSNNDTSSIVCNVSPGAGGARVDDSSFVGSAGSTGMVIKVYGIPS